MLRVTILSRMALFLYRCDEVAKNAKLRQIALKSKNQNNDLERGGDFSRVVVDSHLG